MPTELAPPASPAPTINMPPPPVAAPAGAAPLAAAPAGAVTPPVDLFGEDLPAWVRQFDGAADAKPGVVSKADLDALPLEARRIIQALTHQARGKVADVGTKTAALAADRARHEENAGKLIAEQAALWKMFGHSRIAEVLKAPDGEPPDPYTQEGINWLVKKHTAEQMAELINGITTAAGEAEKEYKASQAEKAYSAEMTALDAFMAERADFMEHADRIEELVQKNGLRFDKAYMLAVAEAGGTPAKAAPPKEDPIAKARTASRLRGSPPPSAGTGAIAIPKFNNIVDMATWLQANPEAQQHIIRRHGAV
jgi:hypothetical protein